MTGLVGVAGVVAAATSAGFSPHRDFLFLFLVVSDVVEVVGEALPVL